MEKDVGTSATSDNRWTGFRIVSTLGGEQVDGRPRAYLAVIRDSRTL